MYTLKRMYQLIASQRERHWLMYRYTEKDVLCVCMYSSTYLQLPLYGLVPRASQLFLGYVEIPSSENTVANIPIFSSFFIPVGVLFLKRSTNSVKQTGWHYFWLYIRMYIGASWHHRICIFFIFFYPDIYTHNKIWAHTAHSRSQWSTAAATHNFSLTGECSFHVPLLTKQGAQPNVVSRREQCFHDFALVLLAFVAAYLSYLSLRWARPP